MENKPSYPQPYCPRCGYHLRLIRDSWYCEKCKIYPEILPVSPISRYGTTEGEKSFWSRFSTSMIMLISIPIIGMLLALLIMLL